MRHAWKSFISSIFNMFARLLPGWGRLVVPLKAIILLMACCPTSLAQYTDASHTSSRGGSVHSGNSAAEDDDAIIFITPTSAASANIGVAYGKRIPHERANRDARRVIAAGKWQLEGAVQITDESVHPERLKEFPITTGFFLKVTNAPQIVENAPNLRPFLQAFQYLNQIEVNYAVAGLEPYSGVTHVDNKVVSIQLQRAQGLYTFDVLFHNHKDKMPPLVNSGSAVDVAPFDVGNAPSPPVQENSAVSRKSVPRRLNGLTILAIAIGAGCLGGGSIYLMMGRQAGR